MLTPKQEAFCLKYIETGNASEAYRLSYDAENMKPETVHRSANELMGNPKVTTRLAELRQNVEEQHGVTIDSLLRELEEARVVAKGREQGGAMVQATLGKAKLAGLLEKDEKQGDDAAKLLQRLIDGLPG